MFRDGASRGKVVIVGAGPAGALSAIYLAKQNYDVEVKECSACARPNDALGGYARGHAHTVRTAWACAIAEDAFQDGGCSGMLMLQANTTLMMWCTSMARSYCKVDMTMLHVQVYEQRALPDPVNRNLDRSYHLAMSHRGMGAVEKVSPLRTPLSHAASCSASCSPAHYVASMKARCA